MKPTLLFLTLATVMALNPTPILQFLVIPEYNTLMTKLWHIGDDIIGFYSQTEEAYVDRSKPEGYLKISPKTSEVKRILDDTVAACHQNVSFLDRSYYYAGESTLLYYCVSNNTLLAIETKDYTVQSVIPVSTSQTFEEVMIGHNEEGHVYILGLPNLLNVPASAASELILVNLTSKTVENHIIFNKGSDSQLLVTGYASDSGVSYILTKGLVGDQTLIRISKILLRENDYELVYFANFTYEKEYIVHVIHNPLEIVDGYLFTNDKNNLLIFDKNGSLFLNQTGLDYSPRANQVYKSGTLYIPVTASKISGSKFYASFRGLKTYAYSVQDGVMNSSAIVDASRIIKMKIALGDHTEQDLLISLDVETFEIKDISTNATLYTSLRDSSDLMVSKSYYFAKGFKNLYVFDRHTLGKLLQTVAMPQYSFHDIATNQILGLSEIDAGCQITYMDLDTLTVSNGPLIKNKDACSSGIIHINITDKANPFFLVRKKNKYLFVSPATYGTASWTFDHNLWATEAVAPGEDGASFSVIYTLTDYNTKEIQVASYKFNKLIKRFMLQDSYNLTTIQTASSSFTLYPRINNKVFMTFNSKEMVTYYETKMAIFDLTHKDFVTYDIPAFYGSPDGVRVFYDKNKTPYLTLSENTHFGQVTTLPQLFDFTKITPMPGVIANLTRSAIVTGPCNYFALDEFHINIGIVRFYDTCNELTQTQIQIQTQKIEI